MPNPDQRILDYLRAHPEGVTDGELAEALDLPNKALANSHCHQLARAGKIDRRAVNGRLRNFLARGQAPRRAEPPGRPEPAGAQRAPDSSSHEAADTNHEWAWEGHIQQAVIAHLQNRGYTILRSVDNAGHERGKDIEARIGPVLLWVTVKGYPAGTDRTPPAVQARNWFQNALFDIVDWRGNEALAMLAIALPDYPTYHELAARVKWLQPLARFGFLWVHANGTVTADAGLA